MPATVVSSRRIAPREEIEGVGAELCDYIGSVHLSLIKWIFIFFFCQLCAYLVQIVLVAVIANANSATDKVSKNSCLPAGF